MTENPNPQPSFIRSGGIVGTPVKLTNQVCSRDSPGNIPIVIYDNQGDYTTGNGAIVENIVVVPTGTVTQSNLLIFYKLITGTVTPEWLLYEEFNLPALGSVSNTAKSNDYPKKFYPVRDLYRSVPQVSNAENYQYPKGIRLNGNSRNYQIGVALTSAIGSLPIIIYLEGGEL